ncbi:MAG: Rab family GTPase [Promethearchaeota archaeon]
MSLEKTELLDQLTEKFFMLYPEIRAIVIADVKGNIIISKEKDNHLSGKIVNLTNFFKMTYESLMRDKTFKKYKMAYIDTINYSMFHLLINSQTIITIFLKSAAYFGEISPYGLFFAEKVSQILRAKKGEEIDMSMPSYEYEEKIFEKYKKQMQQMGFSVGGMFRFKFVIVGDGAVGKTSLVRRFTENKFDKDYKSTIGLNIVSHTFNLLDNEITCSIWDVGGQKHFERFRQTYYLGAQAAFIVFDLTNRQTFENVEYWYDEIRKYGNKKDIVIMLVGNKSDLKKKRKVSYEEGLRMADKLSEMHNSLVSYIETSALDGTRVDEAFQTIAYLFIMKTKEQEQKEIQEEVAELIKSIIAKKSALNLLFISESLVWNPALKILTDIKQLGEYTLIEKGDNQKIYQYNSGLNLYNCIFDNKEIPECDGVFIILDLIDKEFEPRWRSALEWILKLTKGDKPIFIGILVKKEDKYTEIIDKLDLEKFEETTENISIFMLKDEFHLDLLEQLKNLLNRIKFSK